MPYTKIDKEIMGLEEKYSDPTKIESKIQKAQALLKEVSAEVYQLEKLLAKENVDVEKLEGKSMEALFYKWLGMKEKMLQKEREEALVAKLKYDACKEREDNLKQTIKQLTEQKRIMLNLKNQLNQLKNEKIRLIQESNTPEGEALKALEEACRELRSHIKELKEAILPAEGAVETLQLALQSLQSAENWGTYDLLGGGLIADMAKHSKIDDSRAYIMKAERYLQKLQLELRDVQTSASANITITQGATLADVFFDGLIADWYMQSKINQSQHNIREVRSSVAQLVLKLKAQLSEAEKSLQEKEAALEKEINPK